MPFLFMVIYEIKGRNILKIRHREIWEANIPWIYNRSVYVLVKSVDDLEYQALRKKFYRLFEVAGIAIIIIILIGILLGAMW